MLGTVLAMLKTSARTPSPSAAASSPARMTPEARESTVPAAISAVAASTCRLPTSSAPSSSGPGSVSPVIALATSR